MDKSQTHILGTKLDLLDPREVGERISYWLGGRRLRHIVTLNPEICLQAEHDESYRRTVLKQADITVADGAGLRIGGWILGSKTPPRMTGMDVVDTLCRAAVRQKKSLYLVGGVGNTAARAAVALRQQYPGLIIAGTTEGMKPQDFTVTAPDLVQKINNSGAEVLLVAFGAPKQEQWIYANRRSLTSVKVAIGVGGVFDYLSGNVAMPPRWMSRICLEWLFRLLTQRGRLRRIVRAVLIFPWRCLVWRFRMTFIYRKNVIGAVLNQDKHLLLVSPAWSKTTKWQFPQGGIDKGEKPDEAVLREMTEELGTPKLSILSYHEGVYRYVWPKWYQLLRGFKGQKQDLFFLQFTGTNEDIDIENQGELALWRWAAPDEVLSLLAKARKEIGKIVLRTIR